MIRPLPGCAEDAPLTRRPLETSELGPVRIDTSETAAKRQRAERMLDRHSPEDMHAGSKEERRHWNVEAMMAFATEEVRRDREIRRAQ